MFSLEWEKSQFGTFPNEVFSEIGLKVKQRSSFDKTYVIGIAGGHGGYIPTAAEYLEGGYASDMTTFSPKCEKVLIDTSREFIWRMEKLKNYFATDSHGYN